MASGCRGLCAESSFRKKDTYRIYALKTIRKAHIISRSEVAHTLAERSVLSQINNPFIVPLKFSFQSPEKLYLVLAFVNGGELFHHLQREQRFDVNRSRFYTAELLCALECLHGFNVIYRDLKPENILLDYSGHIALCDFGLCKLDMKDEDRTNSTYSQPCPHIPCPLTPSNSLLRHAGIPCSRTPPRERLYQVGGLVDPRRSPVRDVDGPPTLLR
jgi:serum/glucocorticoid-regulated kinase 2